MYAATELRGLRVVDLSVPGGEVIGAVDTPWATASVLPMSDGHVVTAEWGREPEGGGSYETAVRVLDLGTGEGVREVTTWTVPGWVRALSPLGEHTVLLLATGDTSLPDLLLAWDLSDPGAPRELARVELPHHLASDLATVGNHAYVVLQDRYRGGLRVFDFSQPAQPRDVVFVELDYPRTVAVNERVAVLIADVDHDRAELDVVDISDPEHAAVVGRTDLPRLNGLEDLAIVGDHVVVGGAGWGGRGVLHVVDAANPADPIHVLEYPMPLSVDRLVVAGRTVFVKGARQGEGDIQVLDLSDPPRPLQVAVIPLAVAMYAEMSTSTMATQGTRLFVAQWWAGLSVFDAGRCFGVHPRRVLRVFDQ